MSKLIKNLRKQGLVNPPRFLDDGLQYLCMMGSVAYGVANVESDVDLYGYCIPPKSILFPHTAGYIDGLDRDIPSFDQWQQHHVQDKQAGKEYDFSVFSILKYFKLVMENNPNMIDSLFVPRRCMLHSTKVHEHLRENRCKMLHKGSWHKFKGYAYSQMHKMSIKEPDEGSKRYESIMRHGFDVKFAYHVVRLLDECEQILTSGTIDLQQNNEQLKAIRRGEWSREQVVSHFEAKEKEIEGLYTRSALRHSPDIAFVKKLYLECLEQHYGSLSGCVDNAKDVSMLINDISNIIERYKNV